MPGKSGRMSVNSRSTERGVAGWHGVASFDKGRATPLFLMTKKPGIQRDLMDERKSAEATFTRIAVSVGSRKKLTKRPKLFACRIGIRSPNFYLAHFPRSIFEAVDWRQVARCSGKAGRKINYARMPRSRGHMTPDYEERQGQSWHYPQEHSIHFTRPQRAGAARCRILRAGLRLVGSTSPRVFRQPSAEIRSWRASSLFLCRTSCPCF